MILKEVYIIVEELEDSYCWLVTKPAVNDILFNLAPIAVVEDIKQNITDKQYITVMESLMEINNTNKLPLSNNNLKLNKLFIYSTG